jgi:tRNA-specific 2-thiouridylase
MGMKRERIVIGLSGGVDSAVAAWLLKDAGHEVIGVFMKNWEDDDTDEYCTSREDLVDAVSVADVIGIEIEAINFSAEYRERVFSHFLAEYQAGRTPNPDILCNSEIKFKAFLDHALSLGADRIATGHYAGVVERDGLYRLLRAADVGKDQSYFLHRLNQKQLSRTVFPLASWRKSDVRALACRLGLPNHAKRDSTGICFIGERPFREFLNRYLPTTPGDMLTPDGRKVGRHIGLTFYTIGQRQGLGIGGAGLPWYVSGKDLGRNVLRVVQGHEHPALRTRGLCAGDLSWVAGRPPAAASLAAKTRYRQADSACTIALTEGDKQLEAWFTEPQWAVTPGQFVVFYDGQECLGGGVIATALPSTALMGSSVAEHRVDAPAQLG